MLDKFEAERSAGLRVVAEAIAASSDFDRSLKERNSAAGKIFERLSRVSEETLELCAAYLLKKAPRLFEVFKKNSGYEGGPLPASGYEAYTSAKLALKAFPFDERTFLEALASNPSAALFNEETPLIRYAVEAHVPVFAAEELLLAGADPTCEPSYEDGHGDAEESVIGDCFHVAYFGCSVSSMSSKQKTDQWFKKIAVLCAALSSPDSKVSPYAAHDWLYKTVRLAEKEVFKNRYAAETKNAIESLLKYMEKNAAEDAAAFFGAADLRIPMLARDMSTEDMERFFQAWNEAGKTAEKRMSKASPEKERYEDLYEKCFGGLKARILMNGPLNEHRIRIVASNLRGSVDTASALIAACGNGDPLSSTKALLEISVPPIGRADLDAALKSACSAGTRARSDVVGFLIGQGTVSVDEAFFTAARNGCPTEILGMLRDAGAKPYSETRVPVLIESLIAISGKCDYRKEISDTAEAYFYPEIFFDLTRVLHDDASAGPIVWDGIVFYASLYVEGRVGEQSETADEGCASLLETMEEYGLSRAAARAAGASLEIRRSRSLEDVNI